MGDIGIHNAPGLLPALVNLYGNEYAPRLANALDNLWLHLQDPMHAQFELTNPRFYRMPNGDPLGKLFFSDQYHEPSVPIYLRSCAEAIAHTLELEVKATHLQYSRGKGVYIPRGGLAQLVGKTADLAVDYGMIASVHTNMPSRAIH